MPHAKEIQPHEKEECPHEECPQAVIDVGVYTTKSGFAGDDVPRACFRSLVGRPIMPGIMVGLD